MLGIVNSSVVSKMQNSFTQVQGRLNTAKNNFATQKLNQLSRAVSPPVRNFNQDVAVANNGNWKPNIIDTIKNAYGGNAFIVKDDAALSGFIKPVDKYQLSSGFTQRTAAGKGYNISNKTGKQWNVGVDLAVPIGTPVKAMNDGKVIEATKESDGNLKVVIQHSNGLYTQANHLSGFSVKAGDTVKKGQIIAKSGASGGVTGPHLDQMIYRKQGNKYYMIDSNALKW